MTDLRPVIAQAIANLDAEHYQANSGGCRMCWPARLKWPCVTRQVADDLRAALNDQGEKPMTGAELIAAERRRQIEEEGWTPEHDEEHSDKALAWAAACYVGAALDADPSWKLSDFPPPDNWPWDASWWKPSDDDPIRNLKKAGALIAAEIDRLLAGGFGEGGFCSKCDGPMTNGIHDSEF